MAKTGRSRKKRKTTKKDTATLSKIPLGPDNVKVYPSLVELILRVDFIEKKEGKDPKIVFKELPFFKTISSDSLTVASSFSNIIGALEKYLENDDDYCKFESLSLNGMNGVFGRLATKKNIRKSSKYVFIANDEGWLEYISDDKYYELKCETERLRFTTRLKGDKSGVKRIPKQMFVDIAFVIQEDKTDSSVVEVVKKGKQRTKTKKAFKIPRMLELQIVNPCRSTYSNSGAVYAPTGKTVSATYMFDMTPYIRSKFGK